MDDKCTRTYTTIYPRDIRSILRRKKVSDDPRSAPKIACGDDKISYEIISLLDCIHKLLATIFTRIKFDHKSPSTDWVESRVKLIDKGSKTKPNQINTFRMISITRIFSKLYHSIISDEITTFVIQNNYINTNIQKAFIRDISGCVEHCTTLLESVKHAKRNRKTLYITNFDLSDAYGSVPHNLIHLALKHYHLPSHICQYITDLYSKIRAKVVTASWQSDVFDINTGLFQGDTLSQIIFLLSFNILLEYLLLKYKDNKNVGYNFANKD
eukprot:450792_1